jgi:zinc D-Ala-D-Ala carboxypeptidase
MLRYIALCVVFHTSLACATATYPCGVSERTGMVDVFEKAASVNATSIKSLSWDFYGREETGWQIVAPILSRDLKTICPPESPSFASRIAEWQKQEGLKVTGIVDKTVLRRFSRKWQEKRKLKRGFGTPYPGCIYGPAKPLAELDPVHDQTNRQIMLVNKIDPDAYAAYKKMIAAAAKDLRDLVPKGQIFKIFSAHRPPEYNQKLCNIDARCDGVQRANCTLHFTGRALDLVVGGKNGDTKADNRLLQSKGRLYHWLLDNAESFGFVNYAYEPWHWEYVGDLR